MIADELLDRVDADEILHLVAVAAFLGRGRGTRPMMEGNGLASVERRKAYSCQLTPAGGFSMPRTICSQPRISSPDGQLPWQGGVRCT